jgi:hypothetical protein
MNLTESINRIENERDRVIELVRTKFNEVLTVLAELDGPAPAGEPPRRLPAPRKKKRKPGRPRKVGKVVKAAKVEKVAQKAPRTGGEGLLAAPGDVRAAVLACLAHVETTFVEGRPEGVKGMDGSSLRAAVAKRLGLSLKEAKREEFIRSVSNAQQRLKAEGLLKRETGGWWVRAKEVP